MIDWQSHMTPEEAAKVEYHRAATGYHQQNAKIHFRHIRKIAERCRQRARKAKEKEEG